MHPETDEPVWYVANEDQQIGPISLHQLQEAYVRNRLAPNAHVWRPGMQDWIPIRSVLGDIPTPTPTPRIQIPPTPSQPQTPSPKASVAMDTNMRIDSKGFGAFGVGGGFIELTDQAVVISKKSADFSGSGGVLGIALTAATASSTGHTIPYDAISSVNLSEGGWTSRPFMQVLSIGERVVADDGAAMSSPSCFVFKKDLLPDFRKMKDEIEQRVTAAKRSAKIGAPASAADEIKKLGDLLQSGLITQSEFDARKRQLLGL